MEKKRLLWVFLLFGICLAPFIDGGLQRSRPNTVAEPWVVYWVLDPPTFVFSFFVGLGMVTRIPRGKLGWDVARVATFFVAYGLADALQQLGAHALVGHEVRLLHAAFLVGAFLGIAFALHKPDSTPDSHS